MANEIYQVSKLRKIAIGNFLWMMGLMLCAQAFMQIKDPNTSVGLIGFEWWRSLQSLTSLNTSEFSFSLAAIVFAASSLTHLGYLIVYLFGSSKCVDDLNQGGLNE
jgi:hypothetical protein